ncbi:MAG TPA: beta-N-acetylhexosaminidase, partial [Gammaproteobacteria bacterium]|nr:beta-N-acetylhexosaminidase [Gammaproteobacteria bacterium]
MESNCPLGVLMLDIEGSELTAEDRQLLARPVVGGLILFTRNYRDPRQLRELVADARNCNPELLIAVDQEGGRVQRFRHEFVQLPPLHRLFTVYQDDSEKAVELARSCAWVMAAEILHHGIDLSFAPVLDLHTDICAVIGNRAFAADVKTATDLARGYINGMHEAGMIATGKHFPGHGSVA